MYRESAFGVVHTISKGIPLNPAKAIPNKEMMRHKKRIALKLAKDKKNLSFAQLLKQPK